MPRKVFVGGAILTAADVNTNLMDQAVMSFAGTAARGSAIASPVEGMVTYLADTDSLEVYTTVWGPVSPLRGVLQVVQGVRYSTYSVLVAGHGFSPEVPSLSAAITPASTSNKVLVTVAVGATHNVSGVKLLVNGSDSTYIGDTSGSKARASATGTGSIVFLHSPNSTSEQTYTIKIQNTEAGTDTLTLGTNNSIGDARFPTVPASITLMEVAG